MLNIKNYKKILLFKELKLKNYLNKINYIFNKKLS